MSTTLTVAALQLRAHDRAAFEGGEFSVAAAVRDAARETDVLVLPEGTLPAYVLGDDRVDDEAIARGVEELQAVARDIHCVIVAGVALRHESRLFNSAIVIDRDGSIAGSSAKIFLWHFDRKWFAPGTVLAPIDTSAGRLGVMICADGRMPAIARTLVDGGAELLVMPTAWVTSGRDPQRLENVQADLLARVRAFENRVPLVAANKCGTERECVAYCGKSQIIDGAGNVLALAPERAEATIRARIEVGAPRPHRLSAPVFERISAPSGTTRIALALAPLADERDVLEMLDANELVTPLNAPTIDADVAFDPGALIAARASGQRRIILRAARTSPWLESIACARAIELRLYVIVFDLELERAYAVDPDGIVVAGTFDGYRVASFALDYGKTEQTIVAPGTDVAAGLALVESVTHARC